MLRRCRINDRIDRLHLHAAHNRTAETVVRLVDFAQTTSAVPSELFDLVHEAYLCLMKQQPMEFENRAHFFAVCAQWMRRILTDFARSRRYQKRGGGAPHIPLDEALVVGSQADSGLVELDDALKKLALVDERKSRVVELRFFGGLTQTEISEQVGVSQMHVSRLLTASLGRLRERAMAGPLAKPTGGPCAERTTEPL